METLRSGSSTRFSFLNWEKGKCTISRAVAVTTDWFGWNEAKAIVHSDAARSGGPVAGPCKRFSMLHTQPNIRAQEERFCIVNASDLTRVELEQENYNLTHAAAAQLLKQQAAGHVGGYLVVPEYQVAV